MTTVANIGFCEAVLPIPIAVRSCLEIGVIIRIVTGGTGNERAPQVVGIVFRMRGMALVCALAQVGVSLPTGIVPMTGIACCASGSMVKGKSIDRSISTMRMTGYAALPAVMPIA